MGERITKNSDAIRRDGTAKRRPGSQVPLRDPNTGRKRRSGKPKATKKSILRRHKAYVLFAHGASRTEVASELDITWRTAHRYWGAYQSRLKKRVAENADYFDKILDHTFEELDILRDQAAILREVIKESRQRGIPGDDSFEPGSPGLRIAAIRELHKNNQQRMQLKRLLDQRIEITTKVTMARERQNRILRFMENNLCQRCAPVLEEQFTKEFEEMVAADKELTNLQTKTVKTRAKK